MNIQKLECPNCHAGLDSDYGNEGIFFCKYCGQKIIVEEIQNAEYDLKIRKMEMEHETEKIELEHRQQNVKYAYDREKNETDKKYNFYIILALLGFLVFLFIVMFALVVFSSFKPHDDSQRFENINIEYQLADCPKCDFEEIA